MCCQNNCEVLISCRDLPSLRYHMRGDWRESPLGSAAGLAWWTVSWWLWDRCSIKTWLGFCFASERGGEYICKLPRVGFRIDIIKDSKDNLSARNSKYWSKKIFRDIANHSETSMARVKYPKPLASIHIGKQECPLDFEYIEDIYGDVSFQQMYSSGQYSAFQELTSVNLLEFWKILCSRLSMGILNVCSGMREVHDH